MAKIPTVACNPSLEPGAGILAGINNLASVPPGDGRRQPRTQAKPNCPNANSTALIQSTKKSTAPIHSQNIKIAPSQEKFADSNAGKQNIKAPTAPSEEKFADSNAENIKAPTAPSEEKFAYSNSGEQNIKGLTNQTGHVKGNANGVINFGSLTTSSAAQRQP